MKWVGKGAVAALLLSLALAACQSLPGKPKPSALPLRPSQVSDFGQLFGENCAGCHGEQGHFGAAFALNNPVFLAMVDDATLRQIISEGLPGTAMPGFAPDSGGDLTSAQIEIMVHGIRSRWARPEPDNIPQLAAASAGDPARGAKAYESYCQSCHGAGGSGGARAGSIVDPSYLALVNDMVLRTLIVAGRPDLGHPNWQSYVPDHPLDAQTVSDLVAWLTDHRIAAAQSN